MKVIREVKNGVGIITLNKSNKLNYLDFEMIIVLKATFSTFIDDSNIKLIILKAAGDKAFCSGEDLLDIL